MGGDGWTIITSCLFSWLSCGWGWVNYNYLMSILLVVLWVGMGGLLVREQAQYSTPWILQPFYLLSSLLTFLPILGAIWTIIWHLDTWRQIKFGTEEFGCWITQLENDSGSSWGKQTISASTTADLQIQIPVLQFFSRHSSFLTFSCCFKGRVTQDFAEPSLACMDRSDREKKTLQVFTNFLLLLKFLVAIFKFWCN